MCAGKEAFSTPADKFELIGTAAELPVAAFSQGQIGGVSGNASQIQDTGIAGDIELFADIVPVSAESGEETAVAVADISGHGGDGFDRTPRRTVKIGDGKTAAEIGLFVHGFRQRHHSFHGGSEALFILRRGAFGEEDKFTVGQGIFQGIALFFKIHVLLKFTH